MTTPSPPPTMKAWQYSTTTPSLPSALHINPTAPLPVPKPTQHLIRTLTAALNPIDYKPAERIPGVVRFAITTPATPGIDFCGRIVTPAQGSDLKAGQLVFGCAGNSPIAGGALAEYCVAGSNTTALLPEGVEVVDGATMGVAALSAYQSIVPHVREGSRVFINGGSGGTGMFGIQITKAVGCHVTTTCSGGNVALCRELGADRVVDYREENVLEVLTAGDMFDHVVDNVGINRELVWRCHQFLREEGLYVMVGAELSLASLMDGLKRKILPGILGGVKGKVVGFFPARKPEDLRQVAEWVRTGKVKPVIDQRFQFEQAPQAIEKLKTGRAKGKIVIDIASQTDKEDSA